MDRHQNMLSLNWVTSENAVFISTERYVRSKQKACDRKLLLVPAQPQAVACPHRVVRFQSQCMTGLGATVGVAGEAAPVIRSPMKERAARRGMSPSGCRGTCDARALSDVMACDMLLRSSLH